MQIQSEIVSIFSKGISFENSNRCVLLEFQHCRSLCYEGSRPPELTPKRAFMPYGVLIDSGIRV